MPSAQPQRVEQNREGAAGRRGSAVRSHEARHVLSSRESGGIFASLNHIAGAPETSETKVAGGFRVEKVSWRNNSLAEIELDAIHGGGHVLPQPHWRYLRLLGPTPKEPNGPAVIWAVFKRQRPN